MQWWSFLMTNHRVGECSKAFVYHLIWVVCIASSLKLSWKKLASWWICMWNFCQAGRYDSSISVTRLNDTRTHVQNSESASTLTHSTHAHPCTHIHEERERDSAQESFSVAVISRGHHYAIMIFSNMIHLCITPGLTAVWYSMCPYGMCVCVHACQSIFECRGDVTACAWGSEKEWKGKQQMSFLMRTGTQYRDNSLSWVH